MTGMTRLAAPKELPMTRRRFGCLVTAALATSLLLADPAHADDRTRRMTPVLKILERLAGMTAGKGQ